MKPFIAADILLPAPQTDMGLWPALACDQFTSQPEYWQKAEALTQNAPSTLHITLPEAYLESPDVDGRIADIHTAMADFTSVRDALEAAGIAMQEAELAMIPQNLVAVSAEVGMKVLRLMDALDDNDDVQNVYANADFPDDMPTD